jgi:murein DD-endopeptidase / murein LD-carboxypeptidase
MRRSGDAAAERARALIGARFRPQGRSAAEGLDCVGLAAAALGRAADAPRDYPLRYGDAAAAERMLAEAGLARIAPDKAGAGDLLLMRSGPAQLHLAVRTACGFIHADAGLRRVTERPGAPPWPVLSAWRAPVTEE